MDPRMRRSGPTGIATPTVCPRRPRRVTRGARRGLRHGRLGVAMALTAAPALAACGAGEDEVPSEGGVHQVQVTVIVPEGSPTVYLTGSLPELGPWDPAALAMAGEGRSRTAAVSIAPGSAFEYKVTLGSWDREALGPDGSVPPNFQLVVDGDREVRHEIAQFKKDPREYMADWRGSGVEGTLVYWPDVPSALLSEERHVEIWLPPGYAQEPEARYRVLYMHDGQNLFDPRIANTGIDWGIDEAMMEGVEAGLFEPAVVVGVWSSSRRAEEYSPWHGAPRYARFLIEELMPRVNAEFRTLTGPESTFVMGSSMGGLLSYYLVKEHPEHFSACGCVSSHFPLSERAANAFLGGEGGSEIPYVIRDIQGGRTVPAGSRFFFDYGTVGLDAEYGPTHEAVGAWLRDQGRIEGRDFLIRAYQGADHNEASWRARVADQLEWMLGNL